MAGLFTPNDPRTYAQLKRLIESAPAPATYRERNLTQLELVTSARALFGRDEDPLDILVTVAQLYAETFPVSALPAH